MNGLGIIIVEFICSVAETQSFYNVLFKTSLRKSKKACFCFLFISIFLVNVFCFTGIWHVAIPLRWLIILLALHGINNMKPLDSLKHFALIFPLESFVEVSFENLYDFVDARYPLNHEWKSVTISLSIAVVLGIIGFINRKREKIELPKSGRLIFLIFVTELLLVMDVSFASFSLELVSDRRVQVIGKSFWCVGGIVLAFLVYELSNYFSKYQREQNERYIQEQVNDKQREYFEQLLKREEKTRKFRHDISAQLAAIKNYLNNKEYDKAEGFLSEVSDELIRVTEKRYQVGNEIVDVMLNHYLNPDLCRVSVKGYLGNVSIKDRDLCVIVSNLLSNAVDEINRHEYEGPFIRVNVKRGDIFAAIIVENTCCKKMKLREGKRPVSEKNSDEHGHGISNVINLIEKYGGDYSFEADGEVFRAEVVLRYGDGK